MTLLANLKFSFKNLRANKKRSFLTILGIVIGVAAVIIIMAVGAGAQSLIFNQISAQGSNLIGILPGYSDENGPPASVMGVVVTTLKEDDAEALRQIKEITAVASYSRGVDTAQWQNQKIDATFVGTVPDYTIVEDVKIASGSFFDESENKAMARVAVLGYQAAEDLFGRQDPIGEIIKIKGVNFRVIGVVEKRGVVAFQNQDELIFIPLQTVQKLLLGVNYVSMIRAKVINDAEVPDAVAQIRQILRERHDISRPEEEDFSARASAQALDAMKQITDALTFFLAGIAAISLIVGGIGIMNIMLVAVNERTREIGLRKAVGATEKNIQQQFLVDAIVVTLSGGLIGIVLGFIVSALVAIVANYLGYDWDFVITIPSIILGASISCLVGIVFGWYPARQASRLEPVEALRHE